MGPSLEMSCLSYVTWALDGAITSVTNRRTGDSCFIVCCDSLGNQFFFVQDYEDKHIEEALQQEKTVKDRGAVGVDQK